MTIKKIFTIFKNGLIKSPDFIGQLVFLASCLVCVYGLYMTMYQHTWVGLILFIGCPFMAYACRNGLTALVYMIFLFTVFCEVCIIASKDRQESVVKSVFLKGERKHHRVLIPESEDDDGNVSPEHYQTQYYFEMADGQSKFISSLIEISFLIIVIAIPVIVGLILKKRLL
jgi:hypothetical protein